MAISPPREAYENGKPVKFVAMKAEDLEEMDGEYLTDELPEDAHISFWVGDDPEEAPEDYEIIEEPEE